MAMTRMFAVPQLIAAGDYYHTSSSGATLRREKLKCRSAPCKEQEIYRELYTHYVQQGHRNGRAMAPYAASIATSIGSTIAASSFSGLLTRVEIGHIRIGAA